MMGKIVTTELQKYEISGACSMYAWPKELDPARFVGLSVSAITFFEYGFHIKLWESGPEASRGDVTISVYREPVLIVGDSVQEITFPPTTTEILHTLGLNVQRSWVDSDLASLVLEFENTWRLRVRGDLTSYECYEILIDGDRYIV